MEESLSELNKLQILIHEEYTNYRQAIKDDKEFAHVKIIYSRIKELQKEINELADSILVNLETKNSS